MAFPTEENWFMTELQKDIWLKKYKTGDENFEEFFERVSGGNKEIKECMLQNGALGSLMSGSGPTVFGIFDDKDKAMAAKEKCRELPYRCFVFVTDLYR